MRERYHTIGWLTIAVIITTAIWVVLLIIGQATAAPAPSLIDKVTALTPLGALFYVNYANAALITLLNVALFAGLYLLCREERPLWALVGLAFIPMYGLGNLVAYLSQIFVVPYLLTLYQAPETTSIALVLLDLTLQDWPGSAVAALNLGAYALLGIPSLFYGMLLTRKGARLRVGGALLALSGALSIVAFAGVALRSAVLSALSLVSGFIFLLALISIAVALFRGGKTDG
jgi:hypothetical protein